MVWWSSLSSWRFICFSCLLYSLLWPLNQRG
uniref:Uncharacterized protein n=1 Tax=Arundo donax TaxID=35708 RepID=A0A0A9HEK1_ARUDO